MRITASSRLEGDLYELIQAYVGQRRKVGDKAYHPRPLEAYPLEEARRRLRGRLPQMKAWMSLGDVAPEPADGAAGPTRASYLASTLSAGLELVKEGELEARQLDHFADIYLRVRGLRLEAAE